jgi:polysulfide reductase chain C
MNEAIHLVGTLTTQDRWVGLVIWYLFLGGLGAALVAISIFAHRYARASTPLTLWGVLSGEVALAVGSLLLLFHLLDPLHVWRILLPWNVFVNPTAWITWGTQFLIWAMVFGVLYIWPMLWKAQGLRRIPLLNWWFGIGWVRWSAEICERFATLLAWLSILMSIAVAVYTGLLLRSFPAVALWHNPVIPLLFTVSALSTGLAYLLLVQYAVLREHGPLARAYERFDVLLIAVEMALIGYLLYAVLPGSESGRASYALLMDNMGWVVGFLLFGLLVPLLLEIKGSLRAWNSPVPVMAAAVLVLVGGYLLRHYFLNAGVYYFPWANAHHLGVLGSDVIAHVIH